MRRKINPNSQYHRFGLPEFASHTGNADRRRILEENKSIREGTGPVARNFGSAGGFGRAFLRIPEFDYPFIKAMFPEVTARDHETRTKAWQKFARSPLSEPYRLDRNRRNKLCHSITVR